ncbi:MAG: PilT/PilU family type 4a pilus ATPase [Acidobacteriota bacterium]
MEILNEYLKKLLSSCSEELRLEPDKIPCLVSGTQTTNLANVPLKGTQISTLVFPLIPPDVKSVLPHHDEVEFVHPHNLGKFNFSVQKSPAGFVVTVRPILVDSGGSMEIPQATQEPAQEQAASMNVSVPEPEEEVFLETAPAPQPQPEFAAAAQTPFGIEIESSSASRDMNVGHPLGAGALADLLIDEYKTAEEYVPSSGGPEIEIVSVNDPEYQTIFSDTATYEPPGRRDDFAVGEYMTPVEMVSPSQEAFVRQEPVAQPPVVQQHQAVQSQPMNYQTSPSQSMPYQTPQPPAEAAFVPAAANAGMMAKMDALFHKMAEIGASDLHLSVSVSPMIRKDGKMRPLRAEDVPFTSDGIRELLTSIIPARNQEEFAARHDTDFAYEIPGLARFRCNVFMDRKGMGGVFRVIPTKILTAEELGLSKAIMDLTSLSKGLVVVTGPTGSGKSTTLCAMVDSINKNREDHIITIEDPIEFVHENQKCLVNQREVHNHTDSFKDALRAALREDPDILLVGEMRDLETISIAIETAETGHLVFGTLHTTTAASTVDRIIDQFPADRQQQIRVMLSESLKGVIAQTLLPKKGGGRIAALEVLIITPAISNLIREGKVFQIPSAMQTGKNLGMVMLNDALFEHVKNGLVEPMDAYVKAVDKTAFETMLTRGGFKL